MFLGTQPPYATKALNDPYLLHLTFQGHSFSNPEFFDTSPHPSAITVLHFVTLGKQCDENWPNKYY